MMKIENRFLRLSLKDSTLLVLNKLTGTKAVLNWPAVSVSIGTRIYRPSRPSSPPELLKKSFRQKFTVDGLFFSISISIGDGPWLRKKLSVSTYKQMPTPDYVELDNQSIVPDGLELCGYRASKQSTEKRAGEEGTGFIAGCGYPLIGRDFFAGIEHPAAFSLLEKSERSESFNLRHFPVWGDGKLEEVDSVIGWRDGDARGAFADYLDSIRLKPLTKPFISFCTFWSDPYLGDREYEVSYSAYEAFFKAFQKQCLIPDAFTLDAGWNERNSIFRSKKKIGGDKGLVKLRTLARKMGSSLSLWLSHNGPMGIDPAYMKKRGFEVGSGTSAAYSGDGYGVMMDSEFEKALEKRFVELAGNIGAVHFKIDWDNECASNEKFSERYPTYNHVRQASINAFFRIARKLRKVRPRVILRNGWWPSPWWLTEANHLWLPDSGDSEYASLPSDSQRDSAQTHRDLMYYNVLVRDKSAVPLDCFDNHEFPDAFRNPFLNEPVNFTNAVWLSFVRGSTYIAYTIHPESLEPWQANALKGIMKFCSENSSSIFVRRGRMVLGSPGKGEIYGFLQPGKDESWCVLRNPHKNTAKQKLDSSFLSHKCVSALQFYPHFESLDMSDEITFLPHELKVVIFSSKKIGLPYTVPFMVEKKNSAFDFRFPASLEMGRNVKPLAHPVHRIDSLRCVKFERLGNGHDLLLRWIIQLPYRFRDARISIMSDAKLKLRASSGRYHDGLSAYTIPVAEISPSRMGYGEAKNNPDGAPEYPSFYYFSVPDGGEVCISLEIEGVAKKSGLSAWVSGYEAPSRDAVRKVKMMKYPAKGLPVQNPLGFGTVLELPVKSEA